MTNITDTQAILLSSAAARDSGSVLPLPASITAPAGGVARSLASLVTRGLAEERAVDAVAITHRADGDLRLGLFITPAGMAAIGVADGAVDGVPAPAVVADLPATVPPAPARASKTGAVLALLARDTGATSEELIAATGWLPHTMRAALTGLRKKGHIIDRGKRNEVTCYRIVSAS